MSCCLCDRSWINRDRLNLINKVRRLDAYGLLHDGRARTIEQAILWHGGEAQNSKESYMNLPKEKREKLIKLLEEL